MKRRISNFIVLFAVITGVLSTPVMCHAGEKTDKSDMVAGEGEMLTPEEVGEEGMVPVQGNDVKDGNYSIEVDSSSSMFRIVDAKLMVADGDMTAVITMSGKSYLKLYMGTGMEAVEAPEEEYIPYVENEKGAYTFTIPVQALNQELECTAFSKRKEKWYDRQLVFLASSLPEDALLIELPEETEHDETEDEIGSEETAPAKVEDPDVTPVKMKVKDGDYTMEITLSGGSGKATVVSPANIRVSDAKAVATIEWSSPNFDYMIVNGQKYLPVNTEGNSVFEIPVLALEQEIPVIADTVAMSKAHEIEYTLTFHSNTIKSTQNANFTVMITVVVIGAALIIAILGFFIFQKKAKKKV